jgi:hypothetical protein
MGSTADPRNKVGGVACLLLTKSCLKANWIKRFGGQFRTKKLVGEISTLNNHNIFHISTYIHVSLHTCNLSNLESVVKFAYA